MGEVFVAHDTRLDRDVALKILPEEMARQGQLRARFEREAKALAALNHPNVVTIYSVEEAGGVRFLTMELVIGTPLGALVEPGPLDVPRLLHLSRQITRGVSAAHQAGVIHRDLKPDNIMVTVDDEIKILDFGLARLGDARWASDPPLDSEAPTEVGSKTSPGTAMGTAPYMSPEQALGEPLDERTDLFAVGVVLYEMATGHSPFREATLAATFDRILNRIPKRPHDLNPELPERLSRIIERALEKDRERRYPSARELLDELEQLESARIGPAAAAIATPSVAVLPFADLSPESDQEYFCQGLADELINTLAGIEGLRVVARASAFALQGEDLARSEIGRRLDVEWLVQGSLRKSGERLRITAQLLAAADDTFVWSERYDRQLIDVFELQDEIAGTIVGALAGRLAPPGAISTVPQERVDTSAISRPPTPPTPVPAAAGFSTPTPQGRRHPSNLEAYDAFLRGLYAMNRWSEDWVERAMDCFAEALTRDPGYAPAHAATADCLLWFYSGIGSRPASATVPRARAAAQSAVALDPALADGHRCLGLIAMSHDWDRIGARQGFERAIELNPGSAEARLRNAWRLSLLEHEFGAAAEELRRAERLNPLDPQTKTLLGYVSYFSRDLDAARRQFERVVALEPHFPLAHYAIGDVLAQQGELKKAVASYERAIELGGRSANAIAMLAHASALGGDERRARGLLRDLDTLAESEHVSPMWPALARLGLGEVDAVFELLGRAFDQRDGSLVLIHSAPEFDPLRADARFGELLSKMGLAP